MGVLGRYMQPTFTPNNNNESPPASVASGLLGRLRANKAPSSNPDGDTPPFAPAPAPITEEETPKEEEFGPWPGQKSFLGSEYTIENPVRDLWNEEIDYSANVLGNLWLERGSFAVIQGTSGIGKSMIAFQIGVEAALGRSTFGLKVEKPLKVLILQAEDSRNGRIRQASCISKLAETRKERALIEANLRIISPRKRAFHAYWPFAAERQSIYYSVCAERSRLGRRIRSWKNTNLPTLFGRQIAPASISFEKSSTSPGSRWRLKRLFSASCCSKSLTKTKPGSCLPVPWDR